MQVQEKQEARVGERTSMRLNLCAHKGETRDTNAAKNPETRMAITSVRSNIPTRQLSRTRFQDHTESRSSSVVHGRSDVQVRAPSHRPQPFRKIIGTLSRAEAPLGGGGRNGTRFTAQIQPPSQSMTCERRALSVTPHFLHRNRKPNYAASYTQ
jgi:hypothetical protein